MRKLPGKKLPWLSCDIAFIHDNWNVMTNAELASQLGICLRTLRPKLYQLGLKRIELEYWTVEQLDYLISNYKMIGDVEMAEIFNSKWNKNKGWTKKHIEKKRKQLNIKRTKTEIESIKQRNVLQGRYSESHWKRWHGRVAEVGQIRIWKKEDGTHFQVIKTETGFVWHARWLWEQHYGAIPSNYVVRTKDGNPNNITIENLMCISRAQNASLNSTKFHAYPEDLKQSIKLLNKLDKKLKTINNHDKEQIK